MNYITKGVCSKEVKLEVENDIIESIEFIGGCNSNLQGISNLVQGMRIKEAIYEKI